MYGYIYKTTNLINGKIYVGKRQKSTFDKYYYGSGIKLVKALLKYGKENFSREILEWCSSLEELNQKEKYWIKYLDAKNPLIGYNISDGGDGCSTGGKINSLYCYVHKEDYFIRVLKSDLNLYIENGYLKGRGFNGLQGTHKSQETRDKISQSGKGKHNHKGSSNPAYGTRYYWITNGKDNLRQKLEEPIPCGWRKGKFQRKYERTKKQKDYTLRRSLDGHWRGDNNPSRQVKRYWFNDGKKEILSATCPIGYMKGRLRK